MISQQEQQEGRLEVHDALRAAPLIAMTALFTVLAFDTAVPAFVLLVMAALRWLVLNPLELPSLAGRAA